MRVFLSWSGDRSRAVADVLNDRLPDVVHSVDPWMSKDRLVAGLEWFPQIRQAVEECDSALLVVTPENQAQPWLNFEAGAFALASRAAVPLLVGMDESELQGPLTKLQAVSITDEALMEELLVGFAAVDQVTPARRAFTRLWPEILQAVENVAAQPPSDLNEPTPPRTEDQVAEALTILRQLAREGAGQLEARRGPIPTSPKWIRNFGRGIEPPSAAEVAGFVEKTFTSYRIPLRVKNVTTRDGAARVDVDDDPEVDMQAVRSVFVSAGQVGVVPTGLESLIIVNGDTSLAIPFPELTRQE